RPGVGGVELPAARESLLRRHPEGVVAGNPAALVLRDVAERRARKNRTRRGERGERADAAHGLVDVALYAKVRALRAEVADGQAKAARDLALRVQVPRLDVCVVEAMVNGRGREACGARDGERVVEANGSAEGERGCERRVGARGRDEVGDGLVNEYCVSAAQRCLAVAPRVPSEAYARLKVLVVGVIDGRDAFVDLHERARGRVEDDEAVVALSGRHVPVVSKAQIERQVGPELEAVARERAPSALRDGAGTVAERDGEGVCVAGDEGCDRGEDELAVVEVEVVVEEASELAAELERVVAPL